jgi:hypothetical protein
VAPKLTAAESMDPEELGGLEKLVGLEELAIGQGRYSSKPAVATRPGERRGPQSATWVGRLAAGRILACSPSEGTGPHQGRQRVEPYWGESQPSRAILSGAGRTIGAEMDEPSHA